MKFILALLAFDTNLLTYESSTVLPESEIADAE